MSDKIYEYRVYQATPGKLAALQRRFETATLRVLGRYGVKLVGFWIPMVGSNDEVHYIVEWDSLDDMERVWKQFRADPEWQATVKETDKDGPLVARVRNQLWRAAPYAPQPHATQSSTSTVAAE